MQDRFARTDEWKFLIATVQRRILRLSQNEVLKRVCFFHKKLLKGEVMKSEVRCGDVVTFSCLLQIF